MIDEMLDPTSAPKRDRVLRLALGADEQHLAAARNGLLTKSRRAREYGTSATGSMM
jgi:hypothetical protein